MSGRFAQRAGGLFSYFTRHKTASNLLLVVLLGLGLFAIPNMRAQFLPDVIVETVRVTVDWENASPEAVDTAVIQALSPALIAVDGVDKSFSTAREGRATLWFEFEPGWDMARATDDMQTAVDAVTTLPEETEEPVVRQSAWRDRVTDVVISGDIGADQLGRFSDELVVRLFEAGVTRTTIRGVVAPQTIVEVPTSQLLAHDVSMREIAEAIAAEVDANPAGDVDSANARVRTGSERRSPAEISEIVLRVNADGSLLRVKDLAQIHVDGVARARSYYVGDAAAMSIRVDRSQLGDAIGVQSAVQDTVQAFRATLPQGVSVQLIRTRADAISQRLDILLDNGLVGLGLVVVLLFLFLNARIAIWVAAGIPVAMLAAVAIMYAGGITINMVSLFGLIITLGIVVDDAIVVGEHADFRARTMGESPVQAAENAARRMALPVLAASITTIIAFFGLTNIDGRFGELIRDIPLTVIAVLAASLVECFLILPNHMAHALSHAQQGNWYEYPNRVVNAGFRWSREVLFRPLIAVAIKARYVVVAASLLLLASQVVHFINRDVPWRFFNAPERGSVTGNFAMVDGATRADSLAMMRVLQQTTEELGREYEERYGENPIDFVLAEIGGNSGRGLSGVDSKDTDLLGGIAIELIDADLRPYSSFAFVGELQDRVQRHPLTEILSFRGWRAGPGDDSLDVQFYGNNLDVLKAASQDLQTALAVFGEISAVEDSLAYDKDELVLDLTPQGQALGFAIDDLGRVLRARLGGLEAATYPDGPRNAEIRVELPEDELTADFLETTQLRAPNGQYVPLSDVVSVTRRSGFATIERENGLRLLSVTGDLSDDDPARAVEILQQLQQEILPEIAKTHQVDWRLSGLSEQENEFLSDARNALIMVLGGIFLTLAWVFGSWTRPFVVMAIIPFGLVGTIWGHYIWDVPFSMFSIVGLLGMTGIIINDSIVLVTTIDEYSEKKALRTAIVDGAADRLRPVMLTTLTTVLGLTPLLYEGSQQAQFLKPTVITLVYGLGFGMLLVLIVVPALIAIQDDGLKALRALRRGVKSRRMRPAMTLMAALHGAAFALTMGWVMITGTLWSPLQMIVGGFDGAAVETVAFAAFVALALAITVLGLLFSGLRRSA